MEQLESGGEGTAQAFYLRARRWPNGVLPYQIDASTIRKFSSNLYDTTLTPSYAVSLI